MWELIAGGAISIVASIATGILLNRHSSQVAEEAAIRIRRRERLEDWLVDGLALLRELNAAAAQCLEANKLNSLKIEQLTRLLRALSECKLWLGRHQLDSIDQDLAKALFETQMATVLALQTTLSQEEIEKMTVPREIRELLLNHQSSISDMGDHRTSAFETVCEDARAARRLIGEELRRDPRSLVPRTDFERFMAGNEDD